MSSDRVEQIKDIVDDLLSLEVNTVIKHNMTGTKRPNTAGTLVDIAEDYEQELKELTPEGYEEPADLPKLDQEKMTEERLRRMETLAGALAEHIADPTRSLMLVRICDNAKQLRRMFKGVSFEVKAKDTEPDASFKLEDKDKVTLRKIWELGTEEVVMQTVIYLDGDVITRIRPDCYEDPQKKELIKIHNEGVRTSISFWSNLVDLIATFANVFKKL